MDRLQSMQVFVEVVDSGSFTRAASLSGLSQATVSGQIAQLEKHVGARLLERTTRTVKLTEEGTAYYALCQRVLSEIADTESILAGSRSAPRGRLRIDATVALGSRLIVPILPEFIARYPEVSIELHHTHHLYDGKHESFDVLFRIGDLKDSDLIARPISPMRLVVAASPRYLAAHGEPKEPHDLLRHECIGYIDPLTGRSVEWNFEKAGRHIALPLGGHLTCNEGESRIAAAQAGLGLVLTHAYELRKLVRDGELKIVLSDWAAMASHFYVAWPRDRYLSARVRAFVDFVLEKYPAERMLDLE